MLEPCRPRESRKARLGADRAAPAHPEVARSVYIAGYYRLQAVEPTVTRDLAVTLNGDSCRLCQQNLQPVAWLCDEAFE